MNVTGISLARPLMWFDTSIPCRCRKSMKCRSSITTSCVLHKLTQSTAKAPKWVQEARSAAGGREGEDPLVHPFRVIPADIGDDATRSRKWPVAVLGPWRRSGQTGACRVAPTASTSPVCAWR